MKKIGKNDEIIRFFKELLKTNKHKDIIVTDDLEVLHIIQKKQLRLSHLLITGDMSYQKETENLIEELKLLADESYEITKSTYESLKTKENHAGIMAALPLPVYQKEDLGDFIVVLDHLEIPGNIGTIYRTLDSCGATGVLLVDPISKPNNPKITASARGTNLIIPTLTMTYPEAQSYLNQNQYTIYLGEPKLGLDYQKYSYEGKIAIVVGNERFGIQEEWYSHPHQKVFIPMQGTQNSLNVGVAASILAYEAYMKRRKDSK